MRTPVILVAAALTVAIVLAASFLIATGTRGDNALRPLSRNAADLTTIRER
jgi:aldose sugar dehydrogenase